MSVDTKIRPSVVPALPKPADKTPANVEATPVVTQGPTGYSAASTFTSTTRGTAADTLGRRAGNDDSVGRKAGNDDSVGRKAGNDDSVGRKAGNDDSVGRKAGNDDSVGRTRGNDDSVGLGGGRAAVSADVKASVASLASAKGLSAAQQAAVAKILDSGSADVARAMSGLLATPERLAATDSKGTTLLANLSKLATQPMSSSLLSETSRDAVLAAAINDVANPESIAQGDAPTCTVTSMQYELVRDHPSEYVRLLSDLSSESGRAKMSGGSELKFQPGDATALDGRPVSQAMFQTAAMEFGNGKELEFDPARGGSYDASGTLVQHGLKPAQQTQVLRQLFDVNYRSELFQTTAEAGKYLEKLKSIDGRENPNRPIILQVDQGDFNHAVTYDHVKDNDVFYRDPYGVLRTMTTAEFTASVVGMNAPKDLNIIK